MKKIILKKSKRTLSLLLVLLMIVPMTVSLAVPASAAEVKYAVEGGYIYFDPSTGTITDCDRNVTKVDIPSQINGVTVITIGAWAFDFCESLTSITIPDTVTTIDEYAFIHSDSLSFIIIPENVTIIGDFAFSSCSSLESIVIPSSVKTICWAAFNLCENLQNVYYSGTREQWNQIYIDDYYNDCIKYATINYNYVIPYSDLQDIDYLAFSDLVYHNLTKDVNVKNSLGSKWEKEWKNTDNRYRDIYANIQDWYVCATMSDALSGFYAAAFTNGFGDCVIAYRGSSSLSNLIKPSELDESWPDWVGSNIPMTISGTNNKQIKEAIEFYNLILSDYKPDSITFTGHSLGGGLADIMSTITGKKAVSFNSAPFQYISFYKYPEMVSKNFSGIDEQNFYSHINVEDTFVGYLSAQLKPKEIHQHYNHGDTSEHSLASMVKHGDAKLTESVFSNPQAIAWQNSAFYYTVLGTSGFDHMNKYYGPEACAFYSGDGNDRIVSHSLDGDIIVGGKGDDILDGGFGGDDYYYTKGDGVDTIEDISDNDDLYIQNLNVSDKITVSFNESDKYLGVYLNNQKIINIKKGRTNNVSNTFKLHVDAGTIVDDKGNEVSEYNILKYLVISKIKYRPRMFIHCPIDVEIVDDNTGEVVFFIYGDTEEVYFTEYGNFYVAEDENGEFVKQLHVLDGYSTRIKGYEDGVMKVEVANNEGSVDFLKNIPVSFTVSVTFDENYQNILIDEDSDGVIDGSLELLSCDKSGHEWDEWEMTEIPTFLEVGLAQRNCIHCLEIEERSIDKLAAGFKDLEDGKWYTNGILWCYQNGYMAGVSETEFGRKSNVTRAMFATILARIDESDISGYSQMSFTDVKPNQWYSNAIEWAASNGYAAGLGEGIFGYKQNVSREQIALFFYTYSSKNGIDVSAEANLSGYADLNRVHSWALDAVEWAVAKGLISGTSETTLSPRDSATRAEIALIIKNYVENVKR